MQRRNFLAVAGVAAATGLSGCATPSVSREPEKGARSGKPNVLVVIVDQHRADCIGAYGNREVRTPNIDALAADGVRYENAFCCYPVCTPSRYSMFSGMYVHDHGGSSNRCTLRAGIDTYPRILRDAGYRTVAVGKMHFTPTYLDVGFDRMYLAEQDGDGRWDDDYHRELMQRGLIDINDLEDQRREFRAHARKEYWEHFGALPTNLPPEMHSTEWIGRKSLEILGEWGSGGNLLVTSFVKPHHPFDAIAEDAAGYDPAALTLLPGWTQECFAHDLALQTGYLPYKDLSEARLRRIMAYYYATIEQIDRQVGAMVEVLKKKGLYEDAVIVYVSDHGEYMGHHHMILKGNYMYDSLARVPLIVKYPNGRRAGETFAGLVSLVDLAPTLVRQAGCAPGERMTGLDLAAETKGRDIVFAESGRGEQVMARTRTHKLLLSAKPQQQLLYDLERDPMELTDVHSESANAAIVSDLSEKVKAWQGPAPMSAPYMDMGAAQIDQPNVPSPNLGHRSAAVEYYTREAKAYLPGL
ncbi:MAG: sulfatase-like hydrolase/transferase [Candidatus Hydrogenedentes bacterium]|nr:sulfatase-like hydrolase/transferase [Candidatus Hydrogenedentota bacterium]